jgi:hypothetical protein
VKVTLTEEICPDISGTYNVALAVQEETAATISSVTVQR